MFTRFIISPLCLYAHHFSKLFLLQNLSQLASINYDLLTKGLKDEPPMKSDT
jgi:hypothetical protein